MNTGSIALLNRLRSRSQPLFFPNTDIGYGRKTRAEVYTEDCPLDPSSLYGVTKCAAEQNIRDTGAYVVLRAAKVIFLHDLPSRILPTLINLGVTMPTTEHWDEAKEAALLSRADAILVLQEEDGAICHRLAPQATIIQTGISAPLIACDPADQIPGRIIYVGVRRPENYIPLVCFFLNSVWHLVREAVPHATLAVCGDVALWLQPSPDGGTPLPGGVTLVGRVDDLQPHYAAAKLAIIPHILRGGMKLKLVGALSHGRAVVASSCAIDSMPDLAGRCVLVADGAVKFAALVVRVLTDRAIRKAMEQDARDVAAARFSAAACYANFAAFIGSYSSQNVN